MRFDPRSIINSSYGVTIAYLVGKYLPYNMGHRLAHLSADYLSAQKNWKMVQAVRCNQWVVHNRNINARELDRIVIDNFRSIASSIYDLYHNMNNPAASLCAMEPHPVAVQLVQRPEYAERGLVLAGVHMSNFDLAFQTGGLAGIKALAITVPELNRGYNKQWEMRLSRGLNFALVSVGTLKRSVDYLKAGGLVITGLDRPDPGNNYRPRFFGHPAAMPIHHVFLALKAHVPIMVAATYKQPDGKYHFLFSEPIEMQAHPDRHEEFTLNAEKVLHIAEDFIRQDPTQWAMTFPVWTDIADQVPV